MNDDSDHNQGNEISSVDENPNTKEVTQKVENAPVDQAATVKSILKGDEYVQLKTAFETLDSVGKTELCNYVNKDHIVDFC